MQGACSIFRSPVAAWQTVGVRLLACGKEVKGRGDICSEMKDCEPKCYKKVEVETADREFDGTLLQDAHCGCTLTLCGFMML